MKLSLIFLIFISFKLWQVAACKTKDVDEKFSDKKNSSEIAIFGSETRKILETDKSFKELSGFKKITNFFFNF
jgi:hypothetical protein